MSDLRHVKVLSEDKQILREFDGFSQLKKGDRFTFDDVDVWLALSDAVNTDLTDPFYVIEAIKL